MSNLMQASHEWSSRPEDQRFTSLIELAEHCERVRTLSSAKVVSTRGIEARPVEGDSKALVVVGPNGGALAPTNWAFGQLATRAGAPAGYLRDLPAPLAADCINYGLARKDVEDTGVLLRKDPASGAAVLAAVTGPNYGRVWNATIARALVDRFGDGVTPGGFKVPGEFGHDAEITKSNTTLYASDRDMFVFLADEKNRIEIPDRRDGKTGAMARGFFVWNSETGAQTFGISTFLFDYVCCNRIVWGSQDYKEIKIRHTASAPDRWIEEVAPALERYAESSTRSITDAIAVAKGAKLLSGVSTDQKEREEAVQAFLTKRFTRSQARAISAAHLADEDRPIETMWDAVVGATAYARQIQFQDERIEIERKAGQLMNAAA
jgi:hypothetical protein